MLKFAYAHYNIKTFHVKHFFENFSVSRETIAFNPYLLLLCTRNSQDALFVLSLP